MHGLSKRVIEGFNGLENSSSIVVLAGGGMDSFAVALKWASTRNSNYTMWLLVINYGQRTWEQEMKAVQAQAQYLHKKTGVETQVWSETLEWEDNPQGEGGKTDYVPNRNLTFLVTAARIADKFGAEEIGIGIIANHQPGDEISFLDTTPQFLYSVEQSLKWSSKTPPAIYAPFATVPKFIVLHHLVNMIHEHNDVENDAAHHILTNLTYSCYNTHFSTGVQCGTCSSCQGLKRAFLYADIENPYIFLDEIDSNIEVKTHEQHAKDHGINPESVRKLNGLRKQQRSTTKGSRGKKK